jgi:predicted O-linked N-acetylglucosamine transferase (SPINDLY family)
MDAGETPGSIFQSLELALAHHRAGRLRQAEQGYRRILSRNPDVPDVLNNLANILCDFGEIEESERSFRRALALKPDFADAYSNLGSLLQKSGRNREAEESLRAALALRPAYPEALNNLGIVLHESGNWHDAERCFRQALSLMPAAPMMRSNLALALVSLDQFHEAEETCRNAIAADPGNSAAYNNLGLILMRLSRLPEAEVAFRTAARLDPGNVQAAAHWIHVSQHLCIWSNAVVLETRKLRRLIADGGAKRIQPFGIVSLPESTGAEQLQSARQFAATEFAALLARPAMAPARCGLARNKLRIGYLSADFHAHATSQLLVGVLEYRDKDRFEVRAYSYGPDDGSAMRSRMVAACDSFCDIRNLSHEESARSIAGDGVDILVDLKGYTLATRTHIMAFRPAPIQVNWLGYPGTLGHPRLADYVIGDPVVTPVDHAEHFSETLALMPHCYQPNDRSRRINRDITRSDVGLHEKAFVFCCFNQCYKITAAVMDLWCRLLRAVPDSLLWLLQPSPVACENLQREAELRGIDRERIVFGRAMSIEDHLGRLRLADLGLDTFPVTSHTSASDLLWAGVPFVTRIGLTFVSRVAASILTASGLAELVTSNDESYFRLASTLAIQRAHLAELQQKVAAAAATGPLFDSSLFARNLEQLYWRMWHDHVSGKRATICGLPPQAL